MRTQSNSRPPTATPPSAAQTFAKWPGLCAATFSLLVGCALRPSADATDSRPPPNNTLPMDPTADPGEIAPSADDSVEVGSKAISEANSVLQYDFDRPAWTITLPGKLREISDITVLSQNEIACVEDEQGIVFVYDLEAKRITDEVHFASHGDYEGLAVVGSQVYVLRSDGVLFQLASLKRHTAVQKIELHLPFRESEGLCLDSAHSRLLIAPKSHEQSGKGKDSRPIYAYDLRQQILVQTPVFDVSVREIRRFAKHHDLPIPRRPKKNGESMHYALHFMPSAIAMHPVSGEVFIISAVDHVLVSSDSIGNVTGYAVLDAEKFRQPEGIAFLPNGDMLISNEAAGKVATLVLLRRKHGLEAQPIASPTPKG